MVEPLSETEPVLEADAPKLSDAVGVADSVALMDTVVLGVAGDVPVALGVARGVAVPLCVADGVTLLLCELEPVFEAEAPAVREAVLEADRVLLWLVVELGVTAGVPLPVPLPLPVPDAEAPKEGVGEALGEGVALGVAEEVGGAEGVAPLLAVATPEAVEERELDAVEVAVAVRAPLLLPVAYALIEASSASAPLSEADAVGETRVKGELDAAPLVLPLREKVPVPEPRGVAEPLANPLGDAVLIPKFVDNALLEIVPEEVAVVTAALLAVALDVEAPENNISGIYEKVALAVVAAVCKAVCIAVAVGVALTENDAVPEVVLKSDAGAAAVEALAALVAVFAPDMPMPGTYGKVAVALLADEKVGAAVLAPVCRLPVSAGQD